MGSDKISLFIRFLEEHRKGATMIVPPEHYLDFYRYDATFIQYTESTTPRESGIYVGLIDAEKAAIHGVECPYSSLEYLCGNPVTFQNRR